MKHGNDTADIIELWDVEGAVPYNAPSAMVVS